MSSRSYQTSIDIDAPPSVVYPYLTDARSMMRWMGNYVVLDARPGGEFTADINGIPVRGQFVELEPPRRVVFTWGHAGSELLPPGSSTVEIRLEPVNGGTKVRLEHRDLPDDQTDLHAMGWAHYLPRLVEAGAGRDPGSDPWQDQPPFISESLRGWAPPVR